MKDEVYELLDGDMSDDSAAELLHILSVDPDKRMIFRQHLQLQGALYRNQGHGAMTSDEEAEMASRVGSAIGITQGNTHTGGVFSIGMMGLLLLGLALGTGFGYLVNEWTPPAPATPSPTVQVIEPLGRASMPIARIDRDSVVNALRDSLAQSFRDSVSQIPNVVKKATPKRSVRPRTNGLADDVSGAVTGMPFKKKKHSHRYTMTP